MKPYAIICVVTLLGVSACGGATSQSMSASTADSSPVMPEPQPAAAQPAAPQPAAPKAEDNLPDTGAAQQASELPETSVENTSVSFVPNQVLLDGASAVGCDAQATLFNDTMLELINASRSDARMCGANLRGATASLVWNETLAQAALNHGNDMAANNFFSHDGSDGLGVSERATEAGYNWRAIGENLAAGQLDQAEAHQGWLDSPGHCVNVMNEQFTEVGAACVSDAGTDFGTYWVVVFGDAR